MSLIAELLKANAANATALVLNAQSRLTLGVGDLLKLPQGDAVQVLRQGADLVVLLDAGNGAEPERIVVQGFFAAGSLGMVQIGPDGGAQMLTPRSLVAQAPAAAGQASPTTPTQAEAPAEVAEQTAGRVDAQVFQDLGVQDANGRLFAGKAAAAAPDSLVSVLDTLPVQEAPTLLLAVLPEPVASASSPLQSQLAPVLAPLVNGPWINAQALNNFVLSGQGVDGLLVKLQFDGTKGTRIVHQVSVTGGQWQLSLTAAEISSLGEGALTVAATHVSAAGQAFSNTSTLALFIDTEAPKVPTLEAPAALTDDGVVTASEVASGNLNFTIFADAGSLITLTLSDQPGHKITLTGVANANGVCVLNIQPALAALNADGTPVLKDGLIIYQVQSTDAAGNTSSSAEPSFNLYQSLPTAPQVALDAADDSGVLNTDGVTRASTQHFLGQAGSSADKVLVYRDSLVDGAFDGVGSKVELLATLTPDSSGGFDYTYTDAAGATDGSADGRYQFLFVVEDIYGNRSAATPVALTLDTQVASPSLATVSDDDKLSYTELLASTVNFSGTAEASASVTLTFTGNGKTFLWTTTADASGQWSQDVYANVAGSEAQARSLRYGFGTDFNGTVNVAVVQTDLAGNVSGSVSRSVYVRTQPVAQVSSLGFVTGDDTGRVNDDGVTRLGSFGLTGVGPANMLVRVYIDATGNGTYDPASDTLLGELRTDAGGTFSGRVPQIDSFGSVLPSGSYKLITVVYDELSGTTSALTGITQSLAVTVDTVVANVSFDDVAVNNIVTADELSSGTLTLTGRGEPNALVSLSLKAGSLELTAYTDLLVDGTGRWTAHIAAADIIAMGSSTVVLRATQTDLAGNATVLSNSLEKQFDIKLGVLNAPRNLSLLAADDTGASDSDGITRQGDGLTFTGSSQDGYLIKLFRDANNNGVLDSAELLGSAVAQGDGSFAITVDLPAGSHALRVQAYDSFGQTSGPTAPYTVVVDQIAASPAGVQVTSDNIINAVEAGVGDSTSVSVSSSASLSATVGNSNSNSNSNGLVSGTAEALSLVSLQFYSGNKHIAALDKTLTASTLGRWTANLSMSEVEQLQLGSPASWSVKARQTDKAGNVSDWTTQSFVIDTAASSLKTSPFNSDAASAYNEDAARAWRNATGPDAVTWSEVFGYNAGVAVPKTLQVAVGLPSDVVAQDVVKMRWGSQSVLHTVTADDLDRGYALVGISGDAIQRNRTASGSDSVNVTASFIDVAGNESYAAPVISGLEVTLAGTPPVLAPAFEAYNSYDSSSAVYYSRNASTSSEAARTLFTVTGISVAGDRLQIFNDVNLDGRVDSGEDLLTVTADAFGNYIARLSLEPGSYWLRAVSLSSAGASPSDVQQVVIDVAVPASPTLSASVIADDNLVGATERDAGVALSGTGEPFATVNVQLVNLTTGVSGDIYRNVTVDAQGRWSTRVGVVQWGQVGDGEISVRISQSDRAGNTSAVYSTSEGIAPKLIFDTSVATPGVFQLASDNTLNAAEAATSNVVRGSGEPGASVALTFTGSNGAVGPVTVTVNDQGIWSYTLTSQQISSTLGNGLVAVDAVQTDLAGNRSAKGSRVITVDTLAFAPVIDTVANDDTVNLGERSLGVSVTGSAEVGASLRITLTGSNGLTVGKDIRAGDTGTWSVIFSDADLSTLGQGSCTVSATQTDLAGNTSVAGVRNINIATGPLTPAVVLDAVAYDDKVSVTEQTQGITLSGSAPANTTLFLTLSGARGVITQTLSVDADGLWSLPLGTEALQSTLGAGTVTASAYAVNAALQSTELLTDSFSIELAEPSASVSRVASDNYVNADEASAPVVIDGGGVAGHQVVLNITGQLGSLPPKSVEVGSDGKWRITLTVGDIAVLGEGAVSMELVQKASTAADAAASIATTASFTIDRTAPLAPISSDTSIANAFKDTQSDMAGGVTVIEAADGVTVAVALPQDAVAGDRMTLRWGSQEIIQTITAAMLPAQGARVVYVPVPAAVLISQGSGVFDISVVFSDIAGNIASAQVLASSLSVQVPPAAPSINTVYADGYINAVEFAQIDSTATGTLSGNAPDGGTIALTLTGSNGSTVVINSITVTGGAWTASFTSAQLSGLPQGTISAKAVYTSVSGATSAPSVMDFVFDRTAPLAPAASSATAVAAGEANARNELAGGLIRTNGSTTEAALPVTVNVALASDVQSGDTLTLYWGSYEIKTVISQSDLNRGYAQVVVSTFAMSTEGDQDALLVEARVTDKAGNAGARYAVWTGKVDAIPLSPEVNAVSGDYLNAAEATQGWAVTGQGVVGGKVVVTLLGTNLDASGNAVRLVSDEIAVLVDSLTGIPRWRYALTPADAVFLGEGRIKITSIQYDESGNPSDPGKNPSDPSIRYFTIDLQAPAAPTVDTVASDNRISYVEGLTDVTLSGTGESGASVSITVSNSDGSVTKKKSDTVVDGVWSVLLTPAELAEFGGGTLTLTAQQTDPAGNSSGTVSQVFSYATDAVAPPAFTSVTGITPGTDAAFNLADLNALTPSQPYTVSGTGTLGNTVRLTADTASGATYRYELLVAQDGSWSKTFTPAELSDLGQGKVNFSAVQISIETGDESTATTFNTGTIDKSFLIDTIAPTLVSAVVTANGSNGNAKAGDVITVTVQASERLVLSGLVDSNPPSLQLSMGSGQTRSATYDATLSAAAGSDKLIFTYTVVDGDSAVTVTPAQALTLNGASLADLAANAPVANSIASAPDKTLRVDTVAPGTPVITSVDAVANGTPGQMLDGSGNSVNKINASEAAAGVKVRVSLSGTNALEGDMVQLAWTVGTTTLTTTTLSKLLDSTAIGLGYVDVTVGSSSIGILDGSVTLTTRLVDTAGNASGSSSQLVVLVDTAPPARLALNAWVDDNKLSAAEAASTTLDLTLKGTGLETGASIVATITQGSSTINLTAEAGSTPGDWRISDAQLRSAVAALADGAFTITLSQTDAAGNAGQSTTGSYFIDRSVPGKPSITSVPANEDGWINLRDAQTTGVTVLVSLVNTDAQANDTLVLNGFSSTVRYTLTASDITAQSVSLLLPAASVLQVAGEAASVGRALNARIEDQGGNVSLASGNFTVDLDTNIAPPVVDTTRGAARGVSKAQASSVAFFYGSGVEVGAQVSMYFTGTLGTTLLSTSTGQADGSFTVTLQPNDMVSLGDGPVSYRLVQTDVALNTSTDALGSFDLRLSTPLPTLLSMTPDNVVSAAEAAQASTTYQGLGLAGATVSVDFYVRDSATGLYSSTATVSKTATVGIDGFWSVALSAANFTALSAAGQGSVQIKAKQTESDGSSTSGEASTEFYVDRLAPALLPSANLFNFTQEFENSVWKKGNNTMVANAAAAPDSTQTADAFVINLGGATNEFVSRSIDVTAGQTYTYSVYLKNGSLGTPWVELTTDGDVLRRQFFDITAGAGQVGGSVGSVGSFTAKSLSDAGNGWWRASISFTATATTSESFTIASRPANNTSGNVTGDGVSPAAYLWGAQLELASSASAYKRVDLQPALSLFDGNGDGANKDGLLVTFAEAVAVNELIKTTAYTATSGKTMGSDFRIEAVDSRSVNGQFYATKFKLFLDSDSTLEKDSTITINKASVIDSGGNQALANLVLIIPNITVPGQATPPLDIMSDNRINAAEASNVTRLTYSDSNTAAQLQAAQGGLLQTMLNGVVVDAALPKANFLTLDLTLAKAAKLLMGQPITAVVKVTYLDGSTGNITVWATGTAATQTTATTAYRFTSKQPADLANISSISYVSSDLTGLRGPQTVDPTGATTSGLKINGTNVSLTLDFPNTVFLTNGLNSAVTVNLAIGGNGVNVTLNSMGTTETAGGVTRLVYTGTASGTPDSGKNSYSNSVPTNLTLDPAIKVITTGDGAPVIGTRYDTSVAVKTAELPAGAVMTTQLVDASGNAVAGTLDTLSYTTSNPNQVLYTQTLSNALEAAGRKLQMFVDGKPVGAPTTMGISTISMTLGADWENQYGNGAALGGGNFYLQPGATMTARLTLTFKAVAGVTAAPVDVLVTFVGPGGNPPPRLGGGFIFSGAFVNADTGAAIDASTVQGAAYKTGSISPLHPNVIVYGQYPIFSASQYVDLPASAWAGQTEGLKQLTAQTTTADGSLTSVFSAPKQIRLDMAVGSIKDVTLLTDANNNGTLDAGDTLQLRFSENVTFGVGALPASFGSNPVLTAVGAEAGYAQLWNVKLGTGANLAAGQSFTLKPGQVFDQAGNDNASVTMSATVPATVMSRAGTPLIDNVSEDNVVTSTAEATTVKVNLSKALAGDTVRLLMDGVEVGSQQVGANGQASVSFSVAGSAWGADGERQLSTVLTRGSGSTSVSTTSALRSVYVAADTTHWSQESSYAGKVHWFNPDAIVLADGSAVTTWDASAGGMTVANTTSGKTIKMVDVLNGHSYLVTDATSVFYETALANGQYLYQQANATPTIARSATDTDPLLATAGFTDFSMFKPTSLLGGQALLMHPYYRYTSNTAPVTYGTTTVAANTLLLRPMYLGYVFSGTESTVAMADYNLWGAPSMINSASVGSWQMVTAAVSGYAMKFYNQMSLTTSGNVNNYTPSEKGTLASNDISTNAPNDNLRRFRIGGPARGGNDGTGILGDQIDVTVLTKLAYQQEIGAYLAGKYQSTGSVVARNATLTDTHYDLSVSNVPGTLIDQSLQLNDALSNDTVRVAGADYVNAGAGHDVVTIQDLAFRHLDGGQGSDTLMLGSGFTGRSVMVLSDMVSNYRGLSGDLTADARVNDAGYHRLLGFEKIDLVQNGASTNRRQVLTVSASDVNALSETNTLELRLGQEDVVNATGFANNQGVDGIYQVNGSWYDQKYTQTVAGQAVNLYTSGGDRLPEAVSFTAVSALNQVQISFDHAMLGSVLAGNFEVVTYSGPSLQVSSALSVNLRQGVTLTFSGALNVAAKITYTGALVDEAGRGFGHKTWLLGTNTADTLNGATLSASEQASGVTFLGGNGNDSITGTSGADLIIGGLGADVLTGGRGSDTFYFRNEVTGSGAAGGLGGSTGDVITDFNFNAADPSQNDRIDLSALFDNVKFVPTGNASTDAAALVAGGFLEVRKVTNFQTNKQDLQLWADRDGGGLYGQLATISNGGSNLTSDYPAVESNQEFLTRLLDQGRLVVSHF